MRYLLAKNSNPAETKWVTQSTRPKRKGWFVAGSMREGQRLPHPNDAQAWDDLRTRLGHPSR